jgi:hypothetical protein
MFQDTIKVTGQVTIDALYKDGTRKVIEGENLVTTYGQNFLASMMATGWETPPDHMACGTDGSTTTKDMTELQGTELQRVEGEVSVVNNVFTMVGEFGPDLVAPGTAREWGLFDQDPEGNMFARFISTSLDLEDTMTVTVTWRITFGG